MTPVDVDKAKKELEMAAMNKRFDELISEKALARPGFEAKTYTFSQVERVQLGRQETIKAVCAQTINAILDYNCLPRVGITEKGFDVFFDIVVGKFVVFMPKASSTNQPENPKASAKKK